MIDIVATSCLILGIFFITLGCYGLYRFPDIFCRAHALTKALTMGTTLLFIGSWLFFDAQQSNFKLLIAIVFQLATIPISGHILGWVAFRKEVPRWKHREIAHHND